MEMMASIRDSHSWREPDVQQRVRELYPSLRRFAAAVGPTDIDPDDLVQEALIRTMRAHTPDEIADLGAYLRGAVVRLRSNERRRLGRARRAVARLASRAESNRRAAADDRPAEPPGEDPRVDVTVLERLSERDRAAVYLSVVEGRPYDEVAAVIGGSAGAARTRVSRALRHLRAELTALEVSDGITN